MQPSNLDLMKRSLKSFVLNMAQKIAEIPSKGAHVHNIHAKKGNSSRTRLTVRVPCAKTSLWTVENMAKMEQSAENIFADFSKSVTCL
jgi:hypothetical protein